MHLPSYDCLLDFEIERSHAWAIYTVEEELGADIALQVQCVHRELEMAEQIFEKIGSHFPLENGSVSDIFHAVEELVPGHGIWQVVEAGFLSKMVVYQGLSMYRKGDLSGAYKMCALLRALEMVHGYRRSTTFPYDDRKSNVSKWRHRNKPNIGATDGEIKALTVKLATPKDILGCLKEFHDSGCDGLYNGNPCQASQDIVKEIEKLATFKSKKEMPVYCHGCHEFKEPDVVQFCNCRIGISYCSKACQKNHREPHIYNCIIRSGDTSRKERKRKFASVAVELEQVEIVASVEEVEELVRLS